MGAESPQNALSAYPRGHWLKTVTADTLVSWLYTIDDYANSVLDFYE